jgi:tetratricopeptide (TPR) repeat protein
MGQPSRQKDLIQGNMPNFNLPLKRILLFTASFLLNWFVVAQDLEQTYQSGKANFTLGNYQAAALDLERVIFFGAGRYDAEIFEMLGQIHQIEGDFNRSAACFSQAADYASIPEAFLRNKIAQASCLILADKPMLAKIELLGLNDNIPDSFQVKQFFLLGVSEFSAGSFEESRKAFNRAISLNNPASAERIDSLFETLKNIKHPNPKTARILSMILPGAGQFYSGDIKNGVNSLLLTGGFITVGFLVAINYSLLDSFVSIIPWIQRYYIGGFKRAGNIAEDRLLQKQDEIYQQILLSFNKL